MYYRLISYFIILFLCSTSLLATGPSNMVSLIRPISVNNKGDILCRTQFTQNPSGGSHPHDIQYGLCILSSDTILFQEIYTLKFDSDLNDETTDWQEYNRRRNYQDSIFLSDFDPKLLNEIELSFLRNYDFKKFNIRKYQRNDTISTSSLHQRIDLKKASLQALHGAFGYISNNQTKLNIIYDFGSVILTNNETCQKSEDDNDSIDMTTYFNYPNFWNNHDIGYDCFRITGVLFLQKETKK